MVAVDLFSTATTNGGCDPTWKELYVWAFCWIHFWWELESESPLGVGPTSLITNLRE